LNFECSVKNFKANNSFLPNNLRLLFLKKKKIQLIPSTDRKMERVGWRAGGGGGGVIFSPQTVNVGSGMG
jgi:hypothetical protein